MSRRRYPRLDELDGDHVEDFDVGSGSFDKGAGSRRRVEGGAKTDLPIIGYDNPVSPARTPPPPRPRMHVLTVKRPDGTYLLRIPHEDPCAVCLAIKRRGA